LLSPCDNKLNHMLIKEQFDPKTVNKESEAFAATCAAFKIKLPEIAIASGVPRHDVERFKVGCDDISGRDLFKILAALTPQERTFYEAMMTVQDAAEDAGIKLPLLDLKKAASNSDPIRGAMEMTLHVFDLQSKDVCDRAGYASSNFAAWYKGNREGITISVISKIKSGLTREQRAFMNAVINAIITLYPPQQIKEVEKEKEGGLQLKIA
jgi:hypothetical protein